MHEEIRPWGRYRVLSDEADHKVKMIVVSEGKRLSLQRHRKRSEHWYIIRGNALVTLNNHSIKMSQGQSVDIPQSSIHRIENTGAGDVVFIEVQTGVYFGEDDIERFADDYGRL